MLVENRAARPEPGGSQITREHGALPHDRGSVTAISRSSFVARGEADAPDIDGRVYVRGHLPLGEFASVRVVDHTDYDLIAEPA
jgi:ribosomal protein S12 methylthiotransferase